MTPHHFGVVRPEGILLETTLESHVITVFSCLWIIKLFQMNDLHEHMDKKSSLKFHVHEYFFGAHMSVQLASCFNLSVQVEWDIIPESKREVKSYFVHE